MELSDCRRRQSCRSLKLDDASDKPSDNHARQCQTQYDTFGH